MSLLVSDVQYGVWMCCRRIGEHAAGCSYSRQHKLRRQGWARCLKCDKTFLEQQNEAGPGKSNIYHRHLASTSCQFHPGRLQHRGGKLWLYECCSGTPGAEGCRKGRHESMSTPALAARAAGRGRVPLTADALAAHLAAQALHAQTSEELGAERAEGQQLCLQCLRYVAHAASSCRFHAGLFDAGSCARPRTMVPLAPSNIAVLVSFQRVQVTWPWRLSLHSCVGCSV